MGGSISREGNNKKGLAIGLGVGLGVFAWPFLAWLSKVEKLLSLKEHLPQMS